MTVTDYFCQGIGWAILILGSGLLLRWYWMRRRAATERQAAIRIGLDLVRAARAAKARRTPTGDAEVRQHMTNLRRHKSANELLWEDLDLTPGEAHRLENERTAAPPKPCPLPVEIHDRTQESQRTSADGGDQRPSGIITTAEAAQDDGKKKGG